MNQFITIQNQPKDSNASLLINVHIPFSSDHFQLATFLHPYLRSASILSIQALIKDTLQVKKHGFGEVDSANRTNDWKTQPSDVIKLELAITIIVFRLLLLTAGVLDLTSKQYNRTAAMKSLKQKRLYRLLSIVLESRPKTPPPNLQD